MVAHGYKKCLPQRYESKLFKTVSDRLTCWGNRYKWIWWTTAPELTGEQGEWGGPGQRWLVFPPGSVGITVLTSSGYFLLLLLNINNHNSRVRLSRFAIHLNVSRLKHLSFFSQEQNLSGAEPDEFNNRSVVIFPIHQTWWEVAVH